MKSKEPDEVLAATKAGGDVEAQPEVYAIQRGRSGWTLSRRSLFSAAAAAVAAAPKGANAAACANGAAPHTLYVRAVAISPDGRLLVSASSDKTVKLWSLPNGALLKTLTGHSDIVCSVAISPDGRLLVSGSGYFDNTIKLWSLPDGKQLPVCLIDPAVSSSSVSGATYSKDGGTYTLPCGSPIPVGAVCICNCVPGSKACSCVGYSCSCVSYSGGDGHYWFLN